MFYPTPYHAYHQIGNSVCPPVAFALGKQLISFLGFDTITSDLIVDLKNISDESFVLPKRILPSFKRISYVENCKPIFDYMYSKKVLEFSFDDVTSISENLGVDISWATENNFIDEILHNRNKDKILGKMTSRSVCLEKTNERGMIGRFVRKVKVETL
jgi:hypothetical protein